MDTIWLLKNTGDDLTPVWKVLYRVGKYDPVPPGHKKVRGVITKYPKAATVQITDPEGNTADELQVIEDTVAKDAAEVIELDKADKKTKASQAKKKLKTSIAALNGSSTTSELVVAIKDLHDVIKHVIYDLEEL